MKNVKLRGLDPQACNFPLPYPQKGEGRKDRAGFTLFELILAIAILSMVAIIMGSGFRLGIKAWEKGEYEAAETQRLRTLSGLISQALKSAYPYKMKINDKDIIIFEGKKNSILFVTTLHNSSYNGFKWVRFSYKDGSLILNEGILPDKKFMDKIEDNGEVVDSNLGEVRFEYFSSDKGQWQEAWDLGDEIPQAVKVKISYFQPSFIAIPMGVKDTKEKSI